MHRLDNTQIAELLAAESAHYKSHTARAYRKAARAALLWPQEAFLLLESGYSLTELKAIGPFLERQLKTWFKKPPAILDVDESRKDFLTLSQANRILQTHPAWREQLRGDLQMHTEWSDGSASISEMARTGAQLGYEYIAITDHSKGLKIAGGIDEREIQQQSVEIDRVNEQRSSAGKRVTVLRSLEMNISPLGEGDIDPKALRQLDIVLGAFHSALRRKNDQTDRYLAALRNPHFHILAHPRGRIYNHRPGLTADWPRVFAAAAEFHKAVEVDAYPDRQDLNVRLIGIAKREGAYISLGTDAHHPWQLSFMNLALAAMLITDFPAGRILNFFSREKLLAWVRGTF